MIYRFVRREPVSSSKSSDLLSQTTALIKTFQRPKDLDRLIRSIQRYYPELQIMVGDDGLEPSPRSDVDYLRLPEDIGLSAGRNAMLSWEYGLEVQRLVMASYLSAERGRTIDLTDKTILAELDSYVPAIQQGKGAAQLLHAG